MYYTEQSNFIQKKIYELDKKIGKLSYLCYTDLIGPNEVAIYYCELWTCKHNIACTSQPIILITNDVMSVRHCSTNNIIINVAFY